HEQQRVDHDDRARIARQGGDGAAYHVDERGARAYRGDDTQEVPDARVAPKARVESEKRECRGSDRNDPRHPVEADEQVVWADPAVDNTPYFVVFEAHHT